MRNTLAIGFLVVGLLIAWRVHEFTKPYPMPVVEDEYWGPAANKDKPDDPAIVPFKINVSNATLASFRADLEKELRSNRFVEPLETVGFEYGFNSRYLQKVGEYWLKKYDWRDREKRLNKYPQFKTVIAGLDIHFYHVKPSSKRGPARPLLLLHGYPGSVVEYQKMIELLLEPQNSQYNYELIIPSLPGYGFSSPGRRPGLNSARMANIFKRLMDKLGHKKFYLMGGDWGAVIANDLSTLYPSHLFGTVSTNCIDFSPLGITKNLLSTYFPSLFSPPEIASRMRSLWEVMSYSLRESGYILIQSTKPDTVGMGLTHSPLGLAAYILEKFSTWTNRDYISREDGGLEEKFTMDELLDNVMIYWITGSITTAQRLYSEFFKPTKVPILDNVPTAVPYYCLNAPEDVLFMNEFTVRHKYTNIRRFTLLPKGGHFTAMEEPQLVSSEALSFFDSL